VESERQTAGEAIPRIRGGQAEWKLPQRLRGHKGGNVKPDVSRGSRGIDG